MATVPFSVVTRLPPPVSTLTTASCARRFALSQRVSNRSDSASRSVAASTAVRMPFVTGAARNPARGGSASATFSSTSTLAEQGVGDPVRDRLLDLGSSKRADRPSRRSCRCRAACCAPTPRSTRPAPAHSPRRAGSCRRSAANEAFHSWSSNPPRNTERRLRNRMSSTVRIQRWRPRPARPTPSPRSISGGSGSNAAPEVGRARSSRRIPVGADQLLELLTNTTTDEDRYEVLDRRVVPARELSANEQVDERPCLQAIGELCV